MYIQIAFVTYIIKPLMQKAIDIHSCNIFIVFS